MDSIAEFRILTNSFINKHRAKQRRPDETGMDNIEDLYLYRRLGGLEAATAGRSAEDELMDWFTDAEVKEAVEALRRYAQTLPADRIQVNVAAAVMSVFQQDAPTLTMRAVTGRPAGTR